MKNTILLIALVALIAGIAYAAQDSTLSQREVRDPRKLEAILEANATDAETRIAAAQSDTNATTATTSYTPACKGQVLIGSAGAGTTAVWIATGTTTNDWSQIVP